MPLLILRGAKSEVVPRSTVARLVRILSESRIGRGAGCRSLPHAIRALCAGSPARLLWHQSGRTETPRGGIGRQWRTRQEGNLAEGKRRGLLLFVSSKGTADACCAPSKVAPNWCASNRTLRNLPRSGCDEEPAFCVKNKRSRLLAPLGMTGGGTFISIRGPKARPTSLSKVKTRCDACHFEEVDGGGENLRWLLIL